MRNYLTIILLVLGLSGLGVLAAAEKEPATKPAVMSAEELFAKSSPAVVRVVVRDKDFKVIGMGSGFFISEDGLLVTNYHVVKDAEFASVLLSNDATLFVDGVAATDAKADLALLKVNGKDLPRLAVATEQPLKVGAKVYAIGNPQGLTNTLSEGIISGLRKDKEGLTFIQTTASISKGSSGGPLLTLDGRVVGVTSAYLAGGQNLNFAVPAEKIAALLKDRGKLQTLASAGGKPLDKAATQELGKALDAIEKKDWSTATKILTELRKTQKDNPLVWFALGYLHDELENYEIAIEHYKKAISLKPDFAEAYFNMGIAYLALKRYPEAIAAFKQAIAIKPDDADVYFCMGGAYYLLKRYPEAIAAYKKAIALKPDYAGAYWLMGLAYYALERYPEAIAAFKQAIEIKPDFAEAWLSMGEAYDKSQRRKEALDAYKKAVAFCKKAITNEPHEADGYYANMGWAYVLMQDYSEALAACKKAIALNADCAAAYCNMGHAYRGLRRYAEAIAAYKKALSLKPDADESEIYYGMGSTYESLKRYDDATVAYEKAITLDPKGEFGREAKARLAAIKQASRER